MNLIKLPVTLSYINIILITSMLFESKLPPLNKVELIRRNKPYYAYAIRAVYVFCVTNSISRF